MYSRTTKKNIKENYQKDILKEKQRVVIFIMRMKQMKHKKKGI